MVWKSEFAEYHYEKLHIIPPWNHVVYIGKLVRGFMTHVVDKTGGQISKC